MSNLSLLLAHSNLTLMTDALAVGLLPQLAALDPPKSSKAVGWARAWQARGYYPDRPDMFQLPEIAAMLGVDPPLMNMPRWAWAVAWRAGKRAMPLLHQWDPAVPTDTCRNLIVLWLKAIAGNRVSGGYDDGGLAYDLLPAYTRGIVSRPLARLFPPMHHQTIAVRSAFLDRVIRKELNRINSAVSAGEGRSGGDLQTTVVVLGAGFDVRPFRLAGHAEAPPSLSRARWVEIDLPEVIAQKASLLARLKERRPELGRVSHELYAANLSVTEEAISAMRTALSSVDGAPVVFVLEALLIYIAPEQSHRLLAAAVREAISAGSRDVSLCFVDRLPDVQRGCEDDARATLSRAGLTLDEGSWLVKAGLARHMGVARLVAESTNLSVIN